VCACAYLFFCPYVYTHTYTSTCRAPVARSDIAGNFEKFIIGKCGTPLTRFCCFFPAVSIHQKSYFSVRVLITSNRIKKRNVWHALDTFWQQLLPFRRVFPVLFYFVLSLACTCVYVSVCSGCARVLSLFVCDCCVRAFCVRACAYMCILSQVQHSESGHSALLIQYRCVLMEFRTLLMESRALFVECMECRALLMGCRALLTKHMV